MWLHFDQGQPVRLSQDFFIEANKANPPEVRIDRPDRDYRASPIEEVTVSVQSRRRLRPERHEPPLFSERRGRTDRQSARAKGGKKKLTGRRFSLLRTSS